MAANEGEGVSGGGSGIRTHDTVSRIHAFQASAFSHSAIPPRRDPRAGTIAKTTRLTRRVGGFARPAPRAETAFSKRYRLSQPPLENRRRRPHCRSNGG